MNVPGYVSITDDPPAPDMMTVLLPADDARALISLFMLRRKVDDGSASPVDMVILFGICDRLRIYPPSSVLTWLAKAFGKWYDSGGKESLDALLGLKGGRGETPPFKAEIIHARNSMLFHLVGRLIAFGCTPEEASTMVAARLKATDWNKTPWDVGDLEASSILDLWLRAEDRDGHIAVGEFFFKRSTPEQRRDALAMYPVESVPPRLL